MLAHGNLGARQAGQLSVSVAGLAGAHPLDLARQLAARGVLAAYYTALPRSRTPGVDDRVVHRHLALLLPLYLAGRMPIPLDRLYTLIDREFDRWISRRVVQADVAHAVAGLGRAYRAAARQRFGALTVCDSPTSHVRFQQELIEAEHRKWRLPFARGGTRAMARIEQEYAESDLILVPSTFAYQSFIASGVPASNLALTPYGADLDEYLPVGRPDRTFRILFVGTLSLRKGLPYLLDALAGLPWRDAELVLRGGRVAETAALLGRYAGAIPLRIVPPQPRSRLKELYSSASVLVLPSIEDGFGLVIGQALACATPVIATTHTGGPDLIQDGVNGFIVPPGDVAALRDALEQAYADRDRLASMGREARRRMELARGWGRYGDSVVAAFEGALQHRVQSGRAAAR